MYIMSQPEKLVQFRNQLYRCCIEILLKLKQEHFFSQLTQQDIFLFLLSVTMNLK